MRESLLRVIDDLETKKSNAVMEIESRVALVTFVMAMDYAIQELKKVLADA